MCMYVCVYTHIYIHIWLVSVIVTLSLCCTCFTVFAWQNLICMLGHWDVYMHIIQRMSVSIWHFCRKEKSLNYLDFGWSEHPIFKMWMVNFFYSKMVHHPPAYDNESMCLWEKLMPFILQPCLAFHLSGKNGSCSQPSSWIWCWCVMYLKTISLFFCRVKELWKSLHLVQSPWQQLKSSANQ